MASGRTAFDAIIIGAGLAGGMMALRLKLQAPEKQILVLEKASRGEVRKTWSCHGSDLADHVWARELMSKTWTGYEVHFPNRTRSLDSTYHSLLPIDLQSRLAALLGNDLRFETTVVSKNEEQVEISTGEVFTAPCVIDSSTPLKWDARNCGFQKFVGLHVKLDRPHGLTRPILMDARVPQLDGFRFFYVLPFGPDELMIEDTRFSENDSIDRGEYICEITDYATQKGWTITKTIGAEVGVLPLPFNEAAPDRSRAAIGMAAGFFHVVTGYSMPDAIRAADRIARLPLLTTKAVAEALGKYGDDYFTQRRYFHLLNRMMFRAARPEHRYRIFERFYGLSAALIERFYRGELTSTDRVRLLVGKPPVPVASAIRCLLPGRLT